MFNRLRAATRHASAIRCMSTLGHGSMEPHPLRASMGRFQLPEIKNEPFLHYAPGSAERKDVLEACKQIRDRGAVEIPLIINGQQVFTGDVAEQVMPSDHGHVLAKWHRAHSEHYQDAIAGCLQARSMWEAMPMEDRVAIYLKAADLFATKYRAETNAITMLQQGKNMWQAEIDAAVELIDFLRFSAKYAWELSSRQPEFNDSGVWNRQEYRGLEGFVAAITPFNFLAIALNLHAAPAIMGNVCVWKPAATTILGCDLIMRVLNEAGLPDGVVNFVPGIDAQMSDTCLAHPEFAGLHFTGSTQTFKYFYKRIAENLDIYKSYPRIVGETGGKNMHFLHPSANVEQAALQTVRGAFEFQGQKCSATSRVYCPQSLAGQFKAKLLEHVNKISVGQPDDPKTFMTSVIDDKAFARIRGYIDRAKSDPNVTVLAGGECDDSTGYFVQPTVLLTKNPQSETMQEEIFGPVLTIFEYDDNKIEETAKIAEQTSPYALTGSIFARDRGAILWLQNMFRQSAGNFYINDKSTGSIVGQQPFGGGRLSGTNDKSGSMNILARWTNIRSIKENFRDINDFTYPSNKE